MSKWISVKDRLPAEEEDVLVLIKETEHYGKHREKNKCCLLDTYRMVD